MYTHSQVYLRSLLPHFALLYLAPLRRLITKNMKIKYQKYATQTHNNNNYNLNRQQHEHFVRMCNYLCCLSSWCKWNQDETRSLVHGKLLAGNAAWRDIPGSSSIIRIYKYIQVYLYICECVCQSVGIAVGVCVLRNKSCASCWKIKVAFGMTCKAVSSSQQVVNMTLDIESEQFLSLIYS